MRVSIIGQAAFGEAVFRRLRDDGVDIAGVSAPRGARPDQLWAAAEEAGIAPIPTVSLKDEDGLATWRALEADLCVMAFVTEILPEEVFSAAREGTIQYHPSLLPLHRGQSAMNWPIIFGREETGLTIFWPDQGIDTGTILLQERCPIEPDETMGSLYFQQLFPMGVDALSRAVALVAEGEAPRTPQAHEDATYEPPCGEEHARIPWHAPAERVYALIRGCNPSPGAWAEIDGARVAIFDCTLSDRREPGMPGRVLAVRDDGVDIRLNGGTLTVTRVRPEGGPKGPAGAWAMETGIEPGARFR